MSIQNDALVKRIAGLVKENKRLKNQLTQISKKYEILQEKYEIAEEKLKTISSPNEKEPKEKTMRFKMATVLFVDIIGFSNLYQHENSQNLMDELDLIFYEFDQIAKRHNIEKIKTIGDTYMCAGGVPIKNRTNPIEVVLAALEMKNFLYKKQKKYKTKIWEIKIGIHTGPVTVKTSGKKRISYDIKGDTVHFASRLKSTSRDGEINISVMTYEVIKEFFVCDYYGKLPIKYTGNIEVYYVKGIHPELSVENKGLTINSSFDTRFKLIQFGDLQELVLDKLEKELPEYLHYHNVKHTIDVVTQVELIGWGENVNDEEILLLKTAALFHDVGHIISFDEHEYNGTLIAKDMLPNYGYNEKEIERICSIIMATKLPPKPKNKLQEIICDADLDYLGRADFIPVSQTLYDELKAQNKMGSLNDWNKIQIKFLSNHQFFTKTARSLREVNKQKQIERIKKLITYDD